jgi:hypothetical protein
MMAADKPSERFSLMSALHAGPASKLGSREACLVVLS